MPFEDDEVEDLQPNKSRVKNVSAQKSMFEGQPKKPSTQQFQDRVQQVVDNQAGYKQRAADLAAQFKKIMADKTLPENRTLFVQEFEREILGKMIALAVEINNDELEDEGMGSLSWITLLLSTCLSQRDKINKLEYYIHQINKKIDLLAIDNKKQSE